MDGPDRPGPAGGDAPGSWPPPGPLPPPGATSPSPGPLPPPGAFRPPVVPPPPPRPDLPPPGPPPPGPVVLDPSRAGETLTVSHAGQTFDLGFVRVPEGSLDGDVFVIINRPFGSRERFPLTDDGWARAWNRFRELEPAATRPKRPWYRLPILTTVGVFGALVLAGVILGIVKAATQSPGSTMLRDDFASHKGWPVKDTERVRLRYGGGGYEILVKSPNFIQVALLELPDPAPGMSVQAEAVALAGEGELAEGVGCFSSKSSGWLFAVSTDGSVAIIRHQGGRRTVVRSLPSGSETVNLRQPILIRGDCLPTTSGTRLRMYLGGRLLLSATGSTSPKLGIVALTALNLGSQPNGADVRFDDVLVHRR